MTIGCPISEKCAAQMAAAPNPAGWLERGMVRLFAAMHFEIPVGFEDELGFHLGVPAGKPTASFRLEKSL